MNVPRHLALIPDGNRRWARAHGLEGPEGHRRGIARVGEIAEAAWEAGVEVVTFWWGSPANLTKRRPDEVDVIVGSLGDFLSGPASRLLARHDAAFEIQGRWAQLCPSLEGAVAAAEAAAGSGPRKLVALMAYDGRDEILAAAAQGRGDRASFEAALWTGGLPPVDLIVRTGGEPHLSAGFLLWWIAEAQLHFTDTLWPDFDPEALAEALSRYAETPRRLGR